MIVCRGMHLRFGFAPDDPPHPSIKEPISTSAGTHRNLVSSGGKMFRTQPFIAPQRLNEQLVKDRIGVSAWV